MNEPRRFPFGGVPVYNPQSLSKGEALAQFHARQAAYQSLMDLLREERPSHVLIIGTRGMGKTTLLQRVHYGVEDDAELNSRYLVLAFPEEQYNVNRLHHFLLNAVDALADAMERIRNEPMFKRADGYAKVAGKLSQEEIEEQVPRFLAEIGQEMRRNLLLLVDNADRLFDTIDKQEQWRLRELLSNRKDLTLFGATTQASEGIYGTDRAFFEFFQIHRLTPLTFAEVRDLLLRLSESVEEQEGEKGAAKRRVEEWLAADAARLRTLVQLTGGNPRTTVLLFHLVLDGLAGGAREYLEQLLDQCTPNYKGRVDELPAQAQQVLDAVALRWDPVTAMEVGEDTGLETSAVSTQLTRLVRQGLLEKADPGDSKKALYQVAERFFNIWYLMRASRRVRAKLRWFVEFLRLFFESGELEQMAWEGLEKIRSCVRTLQSDIENAFAYILASGALRNRFEDFLRREFAEMESEWGPYLNLIPCTEDSDSAGENADGTARVRPEGLGRDVDTDDEEVPSWFRNMVEAPEPRAKAIRAVQSMLGSDPMSARLWSFLSSLLALTPEGWQDAEAAIRKAIELEPERADFWDCLGSLLSRMPGRCEEAEAALRKAIEVDPKSARSWNELGGLLAERSRRLDDARAAFGSALRIEPLNGLRWGEFGFFLACRVRDPVEAEFALRQSVELEPRNSRNLRNLGVLLFCETLDEKEKEAAGYIRRAHEINSDDSVSRPVSAAILAACLGGTESEEGELTIYRSASRDGAFWDELLQLCRDYRPFGKILIGICGLVQQRDSSNGLARLHCAVALAQLDDFPRASVALEDALSGDPIEQLSVGRRALEVFFAAAVRNDQVRDCLKVLDKKEWKDAWRPIYEALRAVEEGSADYLKRVAVEIREPAMVFLRRIAPELPGARGQTS